MSKQPQGADSLLFTVNRPNVVMSHGKGVYIWDTEGRRYLDFLAGWAVNSLGHSPDFLVQLIQTQAQRLLNGSPSFYNTAMLEFAQALTQHCCMDKVFFTSSGAEANEGAVKLARKYGALRKGGAYKVITMTRSFHGRTLAMMSATGKAAWADLFEPKVPGFIHVPFNDLAAVEAAIDDEVCAVMLEPVQGEGGVYPADPAYMTGLRDLCDQHGILLILDEVQTGFGRTGALFAYTHYDTEPDIMTLGKGIGSGFPLAAMLAKENLDIFEPGDQGGTYTGQPLAMAVGCGVLQYMLAQQVPDNAARMGHLIQNWLRQDGQRYGLHHVRGKGLLIGFDVPKGKGPEIAAGCLQQGLLLNAPGPDMCRLVPPLIIGESHIDEMTTLLRRVLSKL